MRKSRLRAKPKPKNYDPDLALAWWRAVVHRKAACVRCGRRTGLQGHHGVPKAAIEDFCASERLDDAARNRLLWDPRNGVAVCGPCHERHSIAFVRIPRASLPGSVFVFAEELGAMATSRGKEWAMVRLEKEYPE